VREGTFKSLIISITGKKVSLNYPGLNNVRDDGYIKWTHDSEINAGVTCMDFYDLTADGNKEIIVGFDDGTIHVYSIDHEDYQIVPPRLLFSQVRT
jgi:hypothetical protein